MLLFLVVPDSAAVAFADWSPLAVVSVVFFLLLFLVVPDSEAVAFADWSPLAVAAVDFFLLLFFVPVLLLVADASADWESAVFFFDDFLVLVSELAD